MRNKKSKAGALIVSFLFIIAMIWVLIPNRIQSEPGMEVEVFSLDSGGYGYKINSDGHTLIYQPFIPAIGGKKAFVSSQDAKNIGELVKQRMQTGGNVDVTKEDLKSYGIIGN